MARRYSRRRDDGIVEYSEWLEELEASAVRENEETLRGTFALIGFLALFAGACSSAFIFARLAVALRKMFAIALAVGVLGGIGYLVWKVLQETDLAIVAELERSGG
jgi:hypothetical protein